MRTQHRLDPQLGKCRVEMFRVESPIQVFEQFFSRLRKRCFQKRFKTGIFQC